MLTFVPMLVLAVVLAPGLAVRVLVVSVGGRHARPWWVGWRPRVAASTLLLVFAAFAFTGCGGTGMVPRGGGTGGTVGASQDPAVVAVDPDVRFQVMEGFGASVAFYTNWLTEHPNRAALAEILFRDLGLDILRIGNWSQNASASSFADSVTLVRLARAASTVATAPKLLMSSWSPPASLKSTGDTKNGGTLIQEQDGAFAYDAFAQWWSDALTAYAAEDVRPDYISLQNEPNFMATWESCRFGAQPSGTRAGYGPALAAVHARLAQMHPRPLLLGPETAGIAGNVVQDFLTGLDLSQLDGVAHHLYSGGSAASPETFVAAMTGVAVAAAAAHKPIFMTEYADAGGDMVDLAWLINNAVTVEGVAAYLYWDLVWAPPAAGAAPSGLVTVENPFDRSSWTTPAGYVVGDNYHALGHYSRWVDAGWSRVTAPSTAAAVKAAAFASPDGARATVVLVNTDASAHSARVTIAGAARYAVSAVYRSSGTVERTTELGALPPDGMVALPARSIATVVFTP